MENIRNTWDLKDIEKEFKNVEIETINFSEYAQREDGNLQQRFAPLIYNGKVDIKGVQSFIYEVEYNRDMVTESLKKENEAKQERIKLAREYNKYNHEISKYVDGTINQENIDKSLRNYENEYEKILAKQNSLGGRISPSDENEKKELEEQIAVLRSRKRKMLDFRNEAKVKYDEVNEEYEKINEDRLSYEKEQRKYEYYIVSCYEYALKKYIKASDDLSVKQEKYVNEEDIMQKTYYGDDYRDARLYTEELKSDFDKLKELIISSEAYKKGYIDTLLEKQDEITNSYQNGKLYIEKQKEEEEKEPEMENKTDDEVVLEEPVDFIDTKDDTSADIEEPTYLDNKNDDLEFIHEEVAPFSQKVEEESSMVVGIKDITESLKAKIDAKLVPNSLGKEK